MKRKSLEKCDCPVARALDVVGDWWSLLILRDAFLGRRRFGEFQKSLGAARNILAARLRKLVAQEILEAVPSRPGGAHREYVLTEKGRDLFLVVMALRQWGERWRYPGEAIPFPLVDVRDGAPVRPLELRARDGRRLEWDDVTIVPARP